MKSELFFRFDSFNLRPVRFIVIILCVDKINRLSNANNFSSDVVNLGGDPPQLNQGK